MYTTLMTSAKRYKVSFETEKERDDMLEKLKKLNNGRLFREYGNSYLNITPGRSTAVRHNGNYEPDFLTDYWIEIRYFLSKDDVTNMKDIESKIEELILIEEA